MLMKNTPTILYNTRPFRRKQNTN